MNATINIRHMEGVTFLEVNGRVTLGEGSVTLRNAIEDALQTGTKKLVLDLGGVSYMDSSGLGVLTTGYTSAKHLGCDLKLIRLTQKLDDLMQITKLSTVFDVYADGTEAIASFSGHQPAIW